MSPRFPHVAEAIRSARRRKGWSQEQGAEFVGVTRFHWIRWEQGLHMPNEEHRPKLVEMGVAPEAFREEPLDFPGTGVDYELEDFFRRASYSLARNGRRRARGLELSR